MAASPRFLTTRWSLVLAAGVTGTSESRAALDDLCEAYWFPLYAFARRSGRTEEEAQDLVQGFFARALEKNALEQADPRRGRFRSFLLVSFKHYASNERAREEAQKRGGGTPPLSLTDDAEARYRLEPAHTDTPERQYLRDWAVKLLERVLERLRQRYAERDQAALFDALKGTLTAKEASPYAALAEDLGLSVGAVKVAVHRLRARYRETLKAEIADTVDGEDAVEEEIRELFAALSS